MKNIIKIVFLGLVGFAFLIYLTLPKDIIQNEEKKELSLQSFPKFIDVVALNPYTKKEEVFKNFPLFLVVLNHDSLAIFRELYKFTDKNIVLLANISNTPWLIKKIAVNGELENMYKDSKIHLINDSDGLIVKSLNLKNSSQNGYFVYRISDANIVKIFEGEVKKGALQDGIQEDEITREIEIFLEKLDKE